MRGIKVIDISNYSHSWVAEKCDSSSAVFVFNPIAKRIMQLALLRVNKRNIPVDMPEKFFASLLGNAVFYPVFKICEILKKSTFARGKREIDRGYYIWRCLRMLLKQKTNMIESDEELLQKYGWEYLTLEDYKKFKEYYKELKIRDFADILVESINKQVRASTKNLFIIGDEDIYPLLLETINKCLQVENIYFIGDKYKCTTLFSAENNIEFDNVINLSTAYQCPQGMYNYLLKLKSSLNIEYDFVSNNAYGKVSVIKNFSKAVDYLKSRNFELACVCYEYPLQAEEVEKTLFEENIPFRGATQTYKFPYECYIVFQAMLKIARRKGQLTYKEVVTILKALKGELTDKFGGLNKLLRLYKLPVFSAVTLANTSLFGYLIKAWIDQGFYRYLKPEYQKQFLMWKGKLVKSWFEPKVYCGVVTTMKHLNPDISLVVPYSPEEYERIAYTMLTVTSKELILSSL